MNFGSKFVYKYDLSDEESLSDDEFEDGLNLDVGADVGVSSETVETASRSTTRARCGLGAQRPVPCSRGLPAQLDKPKGGISGGISRLVNRFWGSTKKAPVSKEKTAKSNDRWIYRRADTNVVTVKFETLIKPSHMHTGDPEYCANCQAVLSSLSKLTQPMGEDDKVWTCEFCGHDNKLDLMPEEVPKEQDITYMLEPAPVTASAATPGVDDSLVIFCIDISGSMCVTTPVPGHIPMRGDRLDRLQALNTERENQYLPGQSRNVTHVSRLQGAQAAVDHQLEEMKKEHPNRRVALVAFNSEVIIYGDGTNEPVHLASHRLSNKEDLTKMGSEAMLPKPVIDSRKKLGDRIFDLEEGGPTALGPALLFSVALACQVPGARVIICTDGKANVGLGSLDTEDLEEGANFYEEVASMAVAKGVSVSVTTIKGTDCRMEELGRVADLTGGQVNIVDPLRLTKEFSNILADPVIATNLTATFITHKGLYIRENESTDNKVVRHVGNVTATTEITFEFGIKESVKKRKKGGAADKKDEGDAATEAATAGPSAEGATAEPSASSSTETEALSDLSELPFQLQLTYTDLEGAKALRVVTQTKPITTERDVAEEHMDVGVLGVHTAQKTAVLAQEGEYTHSRLNAHFMNNLVHRNAERMPDREKAKYKKVFGGIRSYERKLNQQQVMEAPSFGDLDMDDNMQFRRGNAAHAAPRLLRSSSSSHATPPGAAPSHDKKKLRKKGRSDDLAANTYLMKNASTNRYVDSDEED